MLRGFWARRGWRLGSRPLWALLAVICFSQPVLAQPIETVTDRDYDSLFGNVLRDPSNLDLSFKFAETATRRGDYEAAIGALERMIFYNPGLARVRLELGVLYFRLGSYEMARSYFESSLSGPDVPPEVRLRVEGFLVEIDRRSNVQQLSVFAQLGYRYQTNANAGPTNQLVRAFGQDAVLGRQFINKPDWNAFGLMAVRHVYDFENQRGDVWETNVAGYIARQFRFDVLNIGLAEIQSGPRLALAPDLFPGVSIRPYGLVNGVTLGDQRYLSTAGGGVSLTIPISPLLVLEPFTEGRQRRFENSSDYPIAREQTGQLWASGLFGQGALGSFIGADLRWQARGAYIRNDARSRFDYNSYDQFAVDIGLPIEFSGPWGPRKWAFVPTAGYSHYDYDQANFIVDPFMKRRDDEYRVGALFDVPVYEFAGMAVQVQYATIESNIWSRPCVLVATPGFRDLVACIAAGPVRAGGRHGGRRESGLDRNTAVAPDPRASTRFKGHPP